MSQFLSFLFLTLMAMFANADVKIYELGSAADSAGPLTKKIIYQTTKPEIEGFFENSEKYKIYSAKIFLNEILPIDAKNKKIEILEKSDGLDYVSNLKNPYILIGSEKSVLKFKIESGSVTELAIEWIPSKKSFINNKCGNMAPKFSLETVSVDKTDIKSELPFILATHCRLENKNLFITVSTTADVEWLESSIFESAGKAERWRDYQVPAWSPNGGVISKLRMKLGSQIYNLNLVAPKSSENRKKEDYVKQKQSLEKLFENTIKISSMSLGLNADTIAATDGKYALGYDFLSPKFMDLFKFGGSFVTSLETSKKDEALSFLEVLMHADYVYSINNEIDLSIGPAYQFADFQQKSTNARMQNSQIGLILGTHYLINTENRLNFNIYKTTFFSQIITNNLGLNLEYKYKLGDAQLPFWIGIFFKKQDFDGVNEIAAQRKFKETQIGLSLSF